MTTIESMIGNSMTNSGIFIRETSNYIIDHAQLYTNYAYDQISATIPVIQNYAAITNIYVAEKHSKAITFITPIIIAGINFLQECAYSAQATAIYYDKRNPDLLAFTILFSIGTVIGFSMADSFFFSQPTRPSKGEDVISSKVPTVETIPNVCPITQIKI